MYKYQKLLTNDGNTPFCRKRLYLAAAIILTFIFEFYYIYKHNMSYGISDYNIIFGVFLSIIFLSLILLLKTSNLILVSHVYTFGTVSNLILLIYSSGGIMAPGVFWLTSIPITIGLLYGKKGAFLSTVLTLFVLILFTVFYIYEIGPSHPNIITIYNEIKIKDLFSYFVFCSVVVFFYINMVDKAEERIQNDKERIENLLRILVHDISNPLSVLIFITSKIIEDNNVASSDGRKATNALNTISELVDQVRNYKALEDGKIALRRIESSATQMINETLDLFENKLTQKSIKVSKKLNFVNDKIYVDPVVFRMQVLSNIISNAIKFSYEGSEIVIFGENKDGNLILKFVDFGKGIPETIQNDIFMADRPTSRRGTGGEYGTGFGMPIVKKFVELMDGGISFESTPETEKTGGSTTFFLTFSLN